MTLDLKAQTPIHQKAHLHKDSLKHLSLTDVVEISHHRERATAVHVHVHAYACVCVGGGVDICVFVRKRKCEKKRDGRRLSDKQEGKMTAVTS